MDRIDGFRMFVRVREGMGIAALPTYVAATSVASGHLQPVLQDYGLPSREIHAVYPSPKLLPAKVGILIEYLREAFEPEAWPSTLTSTPEPQAGRLARPSTRRRDRRAA